MQYMVDHPLYNGFKNAIQSTLNWMTNHFEATETRVNDIEYKARDGFIPYTKGGAYATNLVSLSSRPNTGFKPEFDKMVSEKIDENWIGNVSIWFDDNKENFSEEVQDKIEDLSHLVWNFGSASEEDQKKAVDIANELTELLDSEQEQELYEYENDHDLYMQCKVMFVWRDGVFKLVSAINFDDDYFRDKNDEYIAEHDYEEMPETMEEFWQMLAKLMADTFQDTEASKIIEEIKKS